MLNMGYHAGEFTGEILYRATQSNIIYQQQLGRTIDAMRETEPIIIDIVGALKKLRVDAPVSASRTNNNNGTKINGYEANEVTHKCLVFMSSIKEYDEVAKKIELFRCKDVVKILIDAIFSGRITKASEINNFSRQHRINPKYMYSIIKNRVDKGEVTITKTVIGTIGGIAKLEKTQEKVIVTPEKKAEIDRLFRGVIEDEK